MIARKTVCAVILGLGLTCAWPSSAKGQSSIGDAFGQLIGPAVGPLLERAAGEVVLEGVRRGYESGRLFPGRRRGGPTPMPRPNPRPTPRPSPQPVYPQPIYTQPTYPSNPSPQPYIPPQSVPSVQPIQSVPAQSVPTQPVAPRQESVVPPANTIITRPSVTSNAAALDVSLAHVVSTGSEFVWRVIQIEADQIQGQLDASLMGLIEAADEGSELAAMRAPFRKFLASPETATPKSGGQRAELLKAFPSVLGAATAADAAEQLRLLPESTDQATLVQHIDEFRDSLAGLRSNVIGGDELSVLAERAKNLKNMAVLGEIARVMGIQRRDDLYSRIGSAIEKSGAPSEFSYGLLGVALGDPANAVGNMDLPAGNPSVVLFNPQDNPSPISFVCDGSLQLTLAPGELAPFDQSFVVSFQNGAGALKRYTIKEGLFRWAVGEQSGKQAWDLRQKQNIRLTIDASGCPVEFHYLLNGQSHVVAPGTASEQTVTLPPRLDYHNGTAEDSTTATLLTPGRYIVAVNPESGGWELHQEPETDDAMTVASLARQFWSESSRRAIASFNQSPVDAKVDALLNAIE